MAYSNYQRKYAVERQNAFNDTSSNSTGFDSGSPAKSGILLNERVDIDPNVSIIDQRKTPGTAARRGGTGAEYQQGMIDPSASFPFDVMSKTLFPFAEVFFQDGRVTSAAAAKWFAPHSYTSGVIDGSNGNVLTIIEDLGSSNSKQLIDVIASSLELTVEEGGNLQASAELMGGALDETYTPTEDFNYVDVAPLNWNNAKAFIGDGDGTSAVESMLVPGFTFSASNNAVPKHYNSQYVSRFQLGDFTGDGSVSFPWDLDTTSFENNALVTDYIGGNVIRLVFAWGAADDTELYTLDTDNDLTIALMCRLTGASVAGDDETITDASFDLIEYPVVEDVAWTYNDTATSVTLTGTALQGNVFPGDRVIFHDASDSTDQETWFTINSVTSDTGITLGSGFNGGAADTGSTCTLMVNPVVIGMNDGLSR